MPNPTLDEADATAMVVFEASYTKTLNGIDCNTCGNELKDVYPGLVVKPFPPQTLTECETCNKTWHRVL